MPGPIPEHVIAFLAETLRGSSESEDPDAQAIGNAVYGLRGLADSREVRQLVVALARMVERCPAELDAQAVGNSLYGLHRLGDSDEVRQHEQKCC